MENDPFYVGHSADFGETFEMDTFEKAVLPPPSLNLISPWGAESRSPKVNSWQALVGRVVMIVGGQEISSLIDMIDTNLNIVTIVLISRKRSNEWNQYESIESKTKQCFVFTMISISE